MGRAIDRLPGDYDTPRKPPRRSQDLHNDSDATLILPVRTTAERTERDALALRGLARRGASDLAEMFGLVEPNGKPSGPHAIPCTECGVSSGSRCVSKQGNEIGHWHAARVRKAAA